MRISVAVLALLALASCSKPAAPPRPSPVVIAPPPAVAPVAAPVGPVPIQRLICGTEMLEVGYPAADTALVIWKGQAHTLKSATPGAPPYSGDGLQWSSKGVSNGAIATLKASETIARDPGIECVAAPTALPGTTLAGALPGAAAITDPAADAQAAVAVARRYYDLLGSRQSVAAAKFRVDATPQDLSAYAKLSAQLGAPGAVVNKDGVMRVEAPVVVSGELTAGGPFRKAGKVGLRRASDAPGAAPHEWQIERAP